MWGNRVVQWLALLVAGFIHGLSSVEFACCPQVLGFPCALPLTGNSKLSIRCGSPVGVVFLRQPGGLLEA